MGFTHYCHRNQRGYVLYKKLNRHRLPNLYALAFCSNIRRLLRKPELD